jgi:hypothetical protein
VTVVAVSSSANVSDSTDSPADLLRTITGGLTNPTTANVMDPHSTPVLALNALHAAILDGAGFDRERLQEHLFWYARLPADALSARRAHLRRSAGEELFLVDGQIPVTNDTRHHRPRHRRHERQPFDTHAERPIRTRSEPSDRQLTPPGQVLHALP